MPRHLLTAKGIIAARDCDLADGDGLIIRVKGPSATAVLRFTSPVTGSRREMGLGGPRRESLAAAGESLAAVRNAAEDARRLLACNLDPIDERDRQAGGACSANGSGNAAAIGGQVTLRRYTREYHSKQDPVRVAIRPKFRDDVPIASRC